MGCRDTYDHSHSVSAGPSACNRGPENLPVVKEAKKIAKDTAVATEEGEAKVAAKEAKEVAAAKASLEPKAGKAKAAKTEAESSLLLLDSEFPENFPSIQPMPKKYFQVPSIRPNDKYVSTRELREYKLSHPKISPVMFSDDEGNDQKYDLEHDMKHLIKNREGAETKSTVKKAKSVEVETAAEDKEETTDRTLSKEKSSKTLAKSSKKASSKKSKAKLSQSSVDPDDLPDVVDLQHQYIEDSEAVLIRFVDGYDRLVEDSGSFA